MSKWQNIRLGDIADFSNGINFDKSSYCENGTYLIGVSDFGEELFPDYSTLRHIDSTIVRECNLLKDGDIVFVRSNGNKALVGRSMLIKNPPENTSFSGFCIRARIKNHESFDPLFFAYLFKSENFRKAIAGCSIGANIQNLSQGKLASYMAYVPPIEIQRKIADVLSAYDDLIENNRKQIKLLEEAAQRLYKEWFIDLRFPGYENTKIINGIPAGWEKKTVGQLLNKFERTKQVQAADYLETGLFPIIDQSRNFIAGYTNDTETLIQYSQPIIVFGDHTRILKLIPFPFAKGADGTQIIVSNDSNMPQHLFFCSLREIDLSNYHYARHFKYLKTEEILVPTKKIAQKIEMQLSYFFTKIQQCRNVIIKSESARNILLPKLMTGELEVK